MRQERLLKQDKEKLIENLIKLRNDGFTQKEAAIYVGRNTPSINAFCQLNNIRGWPRGAGARNQIGIKNPNFIDGLSKSTISRLTKEILEKEKRNLFLCEKCKVISNIELLRHHKDRNRNNNDPSNLEILCISCHSFEHLEERENYRNKNGTFGG